MKTLAALVAALFVSPAAFAVTATTDKRLALDLETYEPTTLGFTHDGDDVRFMDFKVSVKYPLVPNILFCNHESLRAYKAYIAFSGRWGQYISTRPSSPVVGKRFNPKLILRRYLREVPACEPDRNDDYVDLAYSHESNGQSIDSPALHATARHNAIDRGENPDFVNDSVSRGWDYVELTYKRRLDRGHDLQPVTTGYVLLKYFLPRGVLQGRPEEYNAWEMNPEGKPRKAVNGVAAIVKHEFGPGATFWQFKSPKLAVLYETGYSPAFRHHTYRLEGGIKFVELPLVAWTQRGYGSDLAQYYKKVTSWGVQIEIGSF